jgi:hypothetical protein
MADEESEVVPDAEYQEVEEGEHAKKPYETPTFARLEVEAFMENVIERLDRIADLLVVQTTPVAAKRKAKKRDAVRRKGVKRGR